MLKRRLFILAIIILVLYVSLRYIIEYQALQSQPKMLREPGEPIIVTVFYEALCPDSKNFIIKQLVTTYEKVNNLIEIVFVPYGKATTFVEPDGLIRFECQHGILECQANMYHACSIEVIKDPQLRLKMISCMIRRNHSPREALLRCANEFNKEIIEPIEGCFKSRHSSELLKLYGDETSALRPKVSFIPTITLDGQQGRQPLILKDLFTEVCKVAAAEGPLPQACNTTEKMY